MRKDIIELYEPFYQYTKQPSDSLEWRELRDLVDELIEKIDRPKGKWIEVTNGRGGHECNLCHNYALNWKNGDENLSAYCPNCGADMRGEE